MAERRRMRFARTAALGAAVGLAAIATTGCDLPAGALDAPYPVNLHVEATDSAVAVDAPGWYADLTGIYLCPEEPPGLPDVGPDRVGWAPGPPCHDYGTAASPDGFSTTLSLDALDAAERSTFAAAESWYLLLTDIDASGRVTGATRSRFDVPETFAAS